MTELNDPDNSEQFSLCERLQKYAGDESAGRRSFNGSVANGIREALR
jgi:hypothetical protein